MEIRVRSFIRGWGWPVFRWICVSSIGAGIPLWLETKGIYPARWVAAALGYAESIQMTAAAWLILVGGFGLLIPYLWHLIAARLILNKRLATPGQTSAAIAEEPDWPLHELFSHIDPNVLENDRWERVAQQVRDALGLGHLRAWGRVWQRDAALADVQQWPTPEEIPATYWRRGTFSYTFFDVTRPMGEPDTFPGDGTDDPKYFDVRVNEAKARQIWPSVPTVNAQRVALLEAATQAYERTRHTVAAAMAESDLSGKGTNDVLTWYCWAIWERAPIFGNRPPSRVPEEIPWSNRNSHTFEIEAERLILRDRYRYGSRYENMFVKASDLQWVIERLARMSSKARRTN